MKFIYVLLILAQPALAVHEGPEDTRTPQQKVAIEYSRQFLLDHRTFTSRDIDRIQLGRWISGERFGWGTEWTLTQARTREGLILTLRAKGAALDVELLFDSLLVNIVSVLNTKGGWLWSLPSEQYLDHWDFLKRQTIDEIRLRGVAKVLVQSSKECGAALEASEVAKTPL